MRHKDPFDLKRLGADARTIYDRNSGIFMTVYREDVAVKERIYFTLAHEIGHIVLNHLVDFEQTALNRGGLTPQEYKVLEEEADFFAAELVMPMAVIKTIGAWEPEEIMTVCRVSKSAASNRVLDLQWWGHRKIAHDMEELLKRQFRLYLTPVAVCASPETLPIKSVIKENPGVAIQMKKYDYVATDENGRFIECPQCGNTRFSEEARYCRMCGLYLYNNCTNEPDWIRDTCGRTNPGDARYCEYCGSKTVLMSLGLLKTWEEVLEEYGEVAAGLEPEGPPF